jgi:small subunit ribosomal protein S17
MNENVEKIDEKDIGKKKRQTDAEGSSRHVLSKEETNMMNKGRYQGKETVGVLSKDIGLGVKLPEKICSSERCPFHGHLKVRGRIFKGRIVSTKSTDTAIVEWDYYHYIQKYERYERKKTRIAAHLPGCIEARVDDTVKIGECRPLSKTKRFVVIEKVN